MQELGGNRLLMGHTEDLDTCSRQVVGGDPRQVSKISSGRSVATKNTGLEVFFIHSLAGHILVALQHRYEYDGKWDGNGRASHCWGSTTLNLWMGGAGLPFPSSEPLMSLISSLV